MLGVCALRCAVLGSGRSVLVELGAAFLADVLAAAGFVVAKVIVGAFDRVVEELGEADDEEWLRVEGCVSCSDGDSTGGWIRIRLTAFLQSGTGTQVTEAVGNKPGEEGSGLLSAANRLGVFLEAPADSGRDHVPVYNAPGGDGISEEVGAESEAVKGFAESLDALTLVPEMVRCPGRRLFPAVYQISTMFLCCRQELREVFEQGGRVLRSC